MSATVNIHPVAAVVILAMVLWFTWACLPRKDGGRW